MHRFIVLLLPVATAVAALISSRGFVFLGLLTEDFEIRCASRSKGARSSLAVLALLRHLPSPAIATNSPALVLRVRLVSRVHLLIILVEVDRTLVVWGDVASALLGPAMRGLVASAALVRPLVPHVVPPLVPVAVASVALHQRCLDCVAPRVGSSIMALLEPVLQLAGAVVETEVDLPAHFLSLGEDKSLDRCRGEMSPRLLTDGFPIDETRALAYQGSGDANCRNRYAVVCSYIGLAWAMNIHVLLHGRNVLRCCLRDEVQERLNEDLRLEFGGLGDNYLSC
ncbi:hypothetical protein F5B18DRAFT_519085 [Nemania serpens]|nr:hypothetical protein F5B18DRAFT_519085 [Nemania serpens]